MAHASQNTTGYKAFTATAVAIDEGIRVKIDSDGKVSAAGATDAWIGTTTHYVAADGVVTVRLRNAPGTALFTASAAVTRGNKLYPTASGKVDDAAGTGVFTGFVAVEAATADGDLIEAAPVDVVAFTAAAAQVALTDSSGGTANDTIAAVGATNASDVSGTINDNFADVAAKINALRTALVNAGIIKGAA